MKEEKKTKLVIPQEDTSGFDQVKLTLRLVYAWQINRNNKKDDNLITNWISSGKLSINNAGSAIKTRCNTWRHKLSGWKAFTTKTTSFVDREKAQLYDPLIKFIKSKFN